MTRLLEIRTYRLKPGTRVPFERLMALRCLPLLQAWGMDVVHAGSCALDPDAYVLMRAFEGADHLNQSQDAFYGSEDWRGGPREEVLACIDQYLSVVLTLEESALAALRSLPRGA